MTTPTVRLFRSTDTGAPSLSGTAGALIALLDACLKDGYNSKAVQSITRSGSTATVTFATAHGFAADGLTIVRIAGADQAEYNGDFQISNVTSTAFDITVSGTPATPATGTITAKVAPLDWEKAFSGTNKAVYRAPTGNRLYLRVDDANPNSDTNKSASTRGYEAMSDVDTGTGPFPTVAQVANGIPLTKSTTSDSTARSWVLVGDGYEFHLFYAQNPNYSGIYRQFHFGDPASDLESDPYGSLIYGDSSLTSTNQPQSQQDTCFIKSTAGFGAQAAHYYARLSTQLGGSVGASKHGNYSAGGATIGYTGTMAYPAPHNSGLYLSPISVADTGVLRGQLKGTFQPLHAGGITHGTLFAGAASPIGRRLYTVATGGGGSGAGATLIDIDGPWR
jgi:hypothetical protein